MLAVEEKVIPVSNSYLNTYLIIIIYLLKVVCKFWVLQLIPLHHHLHFSPEE